MKPILMIHEVTDWMFDLPLHEYTLTFDDGLYTQFKYFEDIRKIETEKIFFVSTGIVANEDTEQSDVYIDCESAHDLFFSTGDLSHYMNWSQIHRINKEPQCIIGGHGHSHVKLDNSNIVSEIKLMNQVFIKQNLNVNHFCFPYNSESEIHRCLLLQNGFTKFYGRSRIDICDIK